MKIVVYGTGGVGGYFGARLVQSGNEVHFIARGEHLNAIQQNGLQLYSPKGDYFVSPCHAVEVMDRITGIDLILIAVKSWQLETVAKEIKQYLKAQTLVISLLNGVENEQLLQRILPKENLLGGLCKVVSKIDSPGVIRHMSYEPSIVFGELDSRITQRSHNIEQCFRTAGIRTKLTDNIQGEQWAKFMFITTISGLGALTRSTVGEMLAHKPVSDLMHNVADEIKAVAEALQIRLPVNIKEKQFELIRQQPFETTSSLQRDIMAGRPSEIHAQTGAIVRLGEKTGVSTPVNNLIYSILYLQEQKARAAQ